jgi:hypothetical protein
MPPASWDAVFDACTAESTACRIPMASPDGLGYSATIGSHSINQGHPKEKAHATHQTHD